ARRMAAIVAMALYPEQRLVRGWRPGGRASAADERESRVMASKVSGASSSAQAAGRLSGQPDERAATHESVQAADGTRLHVLRWLPQTGQVRASVLYLHGIATHGAWFSETAELLIGEGIAVYAPDRRGSGRSDGPRGHVDDL